MRSVGAAAAAVVLLSGCATKQPVIPEAPSPQARAAAYNRPYTVRGRTYRPIASARGYRERGIASWYGPESGNRTAMGVPFDPNGLTAAHKTLPLPTWVKVTHLRNGRSVVVLVNDRGPFAKNRLIDLSRGAARALGVNGLAEVEVEALDDPRAQTDDRESRGLFRWLPGG